MTDSNYTEKQCTKCNEVKDLSNFDKRKTSSDGVRNNCKACAKLENIEYRHTMRGVITNIFSNQRYRSLRRNHPAPNYTKNELIQWAFEQDCFHELFKTWVLSGYSKWLKPSFDRLNDYLPYTLDNIQIITWKENDDKGNDDIKSGINNKNSKSVTQSTIDNMFVEKYYSTQQASRDTGIHRSNISSCCRGDRKTSGGYKWSYD